MDELLNKLNELIKGRLEFFFLLISAFLFIDSFSIVLWNTNLIDKLSNFTLTEIIILVVSYLCVFYLLKLVRFLITVFLTSRLNKTKEDKDYYRLKDLLEESIIENNDVKYQNYLRIKVQNESRNNVKTMVFVTLIIGIFDACFSDSIIRFLCSFKIIVLILFLFMVISILYGLQEDEDEYSSTLIRRDKFKIEKKD